MILFAALSTLLFLIASISLCILLYDLKALNKQITYKEHSGGRFLITIQSNHKQLKQLQKEINALYQKIHKLEERADTKEKEMQSLLSAITHDIRTPITSIRGYLDLIQETSSKSEQDHYLTIMNHRLEALNNMLENLFLYAKMSDEEYEVETESILLYPLLCKVIASYYHELNNKQLIPILSFSNEQLLIQANYEMTYRMIQNLIHNVLKHGKTPFLIQEQNGILSFSNAVSPDCQIDLERLFDRFYTKDRARHTSSSGLGLSIVKQIAQLHHWSISAQFENSQLTIRIDLSGQKRMI